MFKKPSKKQLLVRRIIFSVIATLAVIIIVTATVLSMLGFRLDSHNGRLEQGALLQIDSNPGGATVFIDGGDTGSRTATKRTLIAGTHTIKMSKDKYEDWNRTLTIQSGTLTWLDYARLVPKDRTPKSVVQYDQLSQLEFSPDRRWALAHTQPSSPVFNLVDLRSETVKASDITLPATLYSESMTANVVHDFAIQRWNPAGRYALVLHTYGNDHTKEWLVVDTENVSESINVSRLLSINAQDIRFTGANGKNLYALASDNTLRKLDLSAGTISRALATHVQSFSVFDTTVVSYVGIDPTNPAKRVAGVYRDGDELPHVLRTVDSLDTALFITAGKYYGDDYVAIAEGNTVTILKGSYPSSSSQDASSFHDFAEMELTGTVTQLSMSSTSDLVVAQTDTSFASYEIEHRRSARADIGGATRTSLNWLDRAYLWNIVDGKLMMRDFDNANTYTITSAEAAYGASLSTNGRFFYMVAKSDEGYQLQRVRMIVD